MLNYMAMTKRTSKVEWIISMNKSKMKVGIQKMTLIIKLM